MKRIVKCMMALTLSLSMAGPSFAANIEAPKGFDFGKPTSIDYVYTADGGAAKITDLSKNAALIPPAFGSPSAYALNTGEYLTPNLVSVSAMATGTSVVTTPNTVILPSGNTVAITSTAGAVSNVSIASSSSYRRDKFTELTKDIYYSAGHIGTLKIPVLGLSIKIYEGTDSKTLAKGVGHFEETSIWEGNVALAAHNRGVNSYFSEIHTLSLGDKITLTTKLGTRSYRVTSVEKVSETDRGSLSPSPDNILTLYTCVRDERDQRWCVRAEEI